MKLMGYLSCGYPDMKTSMEMADIYLEAGCDGVEMSVPPQNPEFEPPHIADVMLKALAQCADYDVYMQNIAAFGKKHPQADIYNLIYGETIAEIGLDKYLDYFKQAGGTNVLGFNHTPEQVKAILDAGFGMAAPVFFGLDEKAVQFALELPRGIVYLAAQPAPDTIFRDGCDTVEKCVAWLRARGVSLPIYCGVGIRTPEDIARIKQAGADGVFLGSSLLKHYGDPAALRAEIAALKQATLG